MVRIKTEWNTIRRTEECAFCHEDIDAGNVVVTMQHYYDAEWIKDRIHSWCVENYGVSAHEEVVNRNKDTRKPSENRKRGPVPRGWSDDQKRNRATFLVTVGNYSDRITSKYVNKDIDGARRSWGTFAKNLLEVEENSHGTPLPSVELKEPFLSLVEASDPEFMQRGLNAYLVQVYGLGISGFSINEAKNPQWIGKTIVRRLNELKND